MSNPARHTTPPKLSAANAMSSAPMVIAIDETNFTKQVLEAKAPVLVDFGAVWCPPCRAISPHVDAIAAANAGRLIVGKCDTDENPRLATELEIRSVPTLLLFHDGRVIGQLVGAVSRTKLEQFVAAAVAGSALRSSPD